MNRLSLPLSWIAFSIALSLIASSPLAAQVVLSPRIGSTIDSLSREYFGLFPRLRGFREARFERDGADLIALVRRDGAADSSFTVSASVFSRLQNYVDRYEDILAERIPLDTAVLPFARPWRIEGEGTGVRIYTRSGIVYEGFMLYATSEGVLIAEADRARYTPSELDGHVRAVAAADVARVVESSTAIPVGGIVLAASGLIPSLIIAGADAPSNAGTLFIPIGLLSGMLLNAAIGPADVSFDQKSWEDMLPWLRRRSVFHMIEPPEVRRYASQEFARTVRQAVEDQVDHRRFWLAASVTVPAPGNGIRYRITGVDMDTARLGIHDSPGLALEAGYKLSRHFDVAAFASRSGDLSSRDSGSYEAITRTDVALVVDLLLTPRRLQGPRPVEISIGAGGGVTFADLHGCIVSPNGRLSQAVTQNSVVALGLARMTLRANVGETFAIQASVVGKLARTIPTQAYSYYYPNIDGKHLTAHAHEYGLEELAGLIGVHVRL